MKKFLFLIGFLITLSASAQQTNDMFVGYNFGLPLVAAKPAVPSTDIYKMRMWYDTANSTTNSHIIYVYNPKISIRTVETLNLSATRTLTVSSSGSLTLNYSTDYVYTGTTTTWTVPAISSSNTGASKIIRVINRGSGNLTINGNGGASSIYDGGSPSPTLILAPGATITMLPDGTYFDVIH
jgi:hypothetical protein